MATHRAPTPSLSRTLARGVHRAAPHAAHGAAGTLRRTGRGARRVGAAGGRLVWLSVRTLAMLTLAASWVGLLLLLLTLSLAMGKGGNVLRETVSRDMVGPLGEGARQALQSRVPAPRKAAQSHGMRALAGLQNR